MKKLFSIFLLFFTLGASAQNPQFLGAVNTNLIVQALMTFDSAKSTLNLHLLDTTSTKLLWPTKISYRLARESNGRLYQAVPPSNAFVLFDNVTGGGGGSGDSTTFLTLYRNDTAKAAIRVQIAAGDALNVKYTDTAAMFSGYVQLGRFNDSLAAHRVLINAKISTADFSTLFDSQLALKSTSDLAEGTNLYYTNTRVLEVINGDTGRGVTNIVTGGSLNKVRDSVAALSAGSVKFTDTGRTNGQIATSFVQNKLKDSLGVLIDLKAPISTTVTLTETQTLTNKTLTAPKVDGIGAGSTLDSVFMWNPATGNVGFLTPRTIATMVSRVSYVGYDTLYQWFTGARWVTLDSIHGFAPPPSTLLYSHSDWTSSVFANYTATSGAPSYVGSAPFRMLDVNATSATQSFYENSIGFMNLRAYTRSFKFSVQTANTGALITISPLSFVLLPGYTTIFYLEGAEKGKMRSYDPTGGGAWTSALSFNTDDTIQLVEQELFGTRFMKAVRISGTGARIDSVSTTYEDQIWVNGGGTTFATQASTYKYDLQLSNARIYLMEDKVESRMTYNSDVLLIGDSYTLGLYGSVGAVGQTYANSWTRQWQAANPSKTIEFYAGGGVTSAQYATGGALTTQGTFVTSQVPSKVVIMLGTNDQAQSISTSTYIANIQKLVDEFRANGTDSIFVCRLPPNDLFDVTSYNTAQSGLTDVDVFIDTYTPFKDGATTDLDPIYSATDNLPHLNKDGQDLMFSTISAVVNP